MFTDADGCEVIEGKAVTVPDTATVLVVAFVEVIEIFPEGVPVLAAVNLTYIVVLATVPEPKGIANVDE